MSKIESTVVIHKRYYEIKSSALPLFVTLKKVYDRNVVDKYRLYLLLGVIIFNLIDYVYIYVCVCLSRSSVMLLLRCMYTIRCFIFNIILIQQYFGACNSRGKHGIFQSESGCVNNL